MPMTFPVPFDFELHVEPSYMSIQADIESHLY